MRLFVNNYVQYKIKEKKSTMMRDAIVAIKITTSLNEMVLVIKVLGFNFRKN